MITLPLIVLPCLTITATLTWIMAIQIRQCRPAALLITAFVLEAYGKKYVEDTLIWTAFLSALAATGWTVWEATALWIKNRKTNKKT